MALATKPKKTTATKKSQAKHHRHSKDYVKAYWPYLPMLAITGSVLSFGHTATHSLTLGVFSKSDNLTAVGDFSGSTTSHASLIQLITGSTAAWLTLALGIVACIALAVFLLRHSFRLHRTLNRGEAFVAKHPVLDIAMVFVFVTCFVLTRHPV